MSKAIILFLSLSFFIHKIYTQKIATQSQPSVYFLLTLSKTTYIIALPLFIARFFTKTYPQLVFLARRCTVINNYHNLMDDKELIEKILNEDEQAFSLLVKKYLKPIYNFLNQLIFDKSVLDDLTQETFIKVWKNIHRFDQNKKFKTWLFTIAKNTAYDYMKKKKTIPFSIFLNEEGESALENVPDNQILPDKLLESEDVQKNFAEKIEGLALDFQIILKLRYKEDFSLQEIADILNIPYNTVKSRHQRALATLRKELLSQN